MISRLQSLAKICVLKLRYGKRLIISYDSMIKRDINVNIQGKTSTIKVAKMNCYSNVILAAVNGGRLVIGNEVFFNRNCMLMCRKGIYIEDGCIFGPNVVIYDHDHSFSEDGVCKNEYKEKEVVIGKNCWLGANVTILCGTEIGEGAIIGAGCVVKGNIPKYSVVVSSTKNNVISIKEWVKRSFHSYIAS